MNSAIYACKEDDKKKMKNLPVHYTIPLNNPLPQVYANDYKSKSITFSPNVLVPLHVCDRHNTISSQGAPQLFTIAIFESAFGITL